MKIARVCEFMVPAWGGNDFYCCRELAKLGHDVTLYTSDIGPGRYYVKWYWNISRAQRREELVDGFKVVRSKAMVNLGGDMPVLPSLPLEMWSVKADIIHAHEFYNFTTVVAYLISKKNDIPFTFTQERYYWVKRRHWQLPYWLMDKTICKAIRGAPAYVTAFSSAAKSFLLNYGYSPERVKVIPMGVDTWKFKPSKDVSFREESNLTSGTLILSVARLHYSKGLVHLLRAMETIVAEKKDVKLVIIGRGPEEQRLKNMTKRLNLDGYVTFYSGHIAHSDMPRVYNSCDIFTLPSLYEPFGLAVLEAMAVAKPVVVTNVGGMVDSVVHNVTGLKVEAGNHKALAEALLILLSDDGLRKKFGRAGRIRAEKKFDWKIIAGQYERLYLKILEDSKFKS